ncbi:hypothetical protein AB0G49_23635 [Streptomyces longwoodensis]|uniref:hypothetical protein n=1 Tax=Streptomyces longwoodensis TaxID=68231 RepID=UPI0033ED2202
MRTGTATQVTDATRTHPADHADPVTPAPAHGTDPVNPAGETDPVTPAEEPDPVTSVDKTDPVHPARTTAPAPAPPRQSTQRAPHPS